MPRTIISKFAPRGSKNTFFEITRSFAGSSAIESVDIDILDVNDNDPIFKLNKYNAVLIPSATNIGDFVVNVRLNLPRTLY